MTITLSLVYGGTTVALNASGVTLMAYAPKPGSASSGVDKSGIKKAVDTAEVMITGATVAAVLTLKESIEAALFQAEEYQERKTGERVYVHFLPEGASDTRRAEVLSGRLTLDEGALEAWQWGAKKVRAAVIFERIGEWESTTETAVPLTNGNGTNNTSGLNVFNCNDGSGSSPNVRHNYVAIGSTAILGNLPSACRIEMTNQYNSASRMYNVWLAQNVFSDPANFQHMLEGEAVSYGGSNSASASYSGGYTRSFSWAGDTQAIMARWLLNGTYLSRSAGRWFKILAAFGADPGAGIKLQCKITFPAGTPITVVASSQEVTLATYGRLQDIGTLQIAPWLAGETSLTDVDLTLYARKVGGGAIAIDYLQVTPLDGYRLLVPRGYGAAYTIRLVDDGIGKVVWTDGWTPAGKTGHYTTSGDALMLYPGRAQRIYFLQSGDSGDIAITRLLNVKIFYRARYA